MIYGLNFGGGPIPEAVRAKFARYRHFRAEFVKVTGKYELQGCCTDKKELAQMLVIANSGRRKLAALGPRRIGNERYFAVYVR